MKAVCWRLDDHQAVVYTEDRAVVERLLETEPFAGRTERCFSTYANGRGKVFAWQSSFDAALWPKLLRHLRRRQVEVEDRSARSVNVERRASSAKSPGATADRGSAGARRPAPSVECEGARGKGEAAGTKPPRSDGSSPPRAAGARKSGERAPGSKSRSDATKPASADREAVPTRGGGFHTALRGFQSAEGAGTRQKTKPSAPAQLALEMSQQLSGGAPARTRNTAAKRAATVTSHPPKPAPPARKEASGASGRDGGRRRG